jgi:hypothetical protein
MNERQASQGAIGTGRKSWRALAPLALLLWGAELRGLAAEPQAGCAKLLTAAELGAISPGAEALGAIVRGDGHSECSWSLPGSGSAEASTLAVTFWEASGMANALVPADSPREFFDLYVQSAEQVRNTPGELLKGVGLRSALFRDGAVRELYVLTRSGVAHLVTDALSDGQLAAAGKAIDTASP